MEVGCVIFGMTPKKNQKDKRGITVLKDGMRWRFGRNSNRHSSQGKYGAHSPAPTTGTGKFMVR